MKFCIATTDHLESICKITVEAKAQLKAMGVDQWQNGYPSKEIWVEDIKDQRAYVAVDSESNDVMGAFTFFTSQDASYDSIDGAWLTGDIHKDGGYASLHRVCVSNTHKGKGVAGSMFLFAESLTRNQNIASIRIDTHPDNKPMLRSLDKAGFTRCGLIALVSGVEAGSLRVAFEKIL